MTRFDDHHHRTSKQRDEMRAREANRQRQREWERDQRDQEERVKQDLRDREARRETVDYAERLVSETPLNDALPPEAGLVGPTVKAARDAYQGREVIADDLKHAGAEAVRSVYGDARDPFVEMKVQDLERLKDRKEREPEPGPGASPDR